MKTAIAVGACALALALPLSSVAQTVTTVMSNLDNPRGLAFGPEGGVYVVEAGRGGTGPCAMLRGLPRCYGATGAISRYWRGQQERVAVGLPSYSDAAFTEVTGPHDIVFRGQGRGRALVTIGFGGDPAERALFGPVGARFGTLQHVTPRAARTVADVSAHEAEQNPAGGPVDSNPYGALADRSSTLVVDAGANALLRVRMDGDVETIATFRARPAAETDSVPTAVARGPDGAYYVAELTGAPFAEGAARIYRVVEGEAPQIAFSGFKTIIDLDFGPDGSLYVLQHATGPLFFAGPGQVIRIAPDGSRSVVVDGLARPTSVLVAPDGSLYVSNRGASVQTGEVLHVVP